MAPSIRPGSLEQAVYTWSSRNLNNARGQGIAEVSPGLRGSVAWLESLDLPRFRPFAPGNASEADGYPGWKELVTIGSMSLGEQTVVYRKIAGAGEDGAERNRFVTQILVGGAEDLSLAAIADDDPCWLSADRCPLDRVPKLAPVEVGGLKPRSAGHNCAQADAAAKQLLEELIAEPGRLHVATDFGSLSPAMLLLMAVPSALWSAIDLTWWVGSEGPLFTAEVKGEALPAEVSTTQGVERSQLHQCGFHRDVEEIWSRLRGGLRTWEGFAAAFSAPGGTQVPAEAPTPVALPAATAREEVLALAASVTGEEEWEGAEAAPLSEQQALAFLKAAAKLSSPAPDLTSLLDAAEMRALLGGLVDNPALARGARYCEETAAPPALEAAWRETSLAVLGLAALQGEDDESRGGNWAVPKRIDGEELGKLCGYLLRSEAGIGQLGRLLEGGFAATVARRRRFVVALREGGAQSRHVFADVLTAADLEPATVADFVRENLDEFAGWCGIPEPYVKALRAGLGPRRRFRRLLPFLPETELLG